MSCYACSKNYGFFCKEVGCPNCGFSFCTKCLKKTIEVPKCGNAVKKVCLKCYETLLAKSLETKAMEMNEALGIDENIPLAAAAAVVTSSSVLDAPIPESEKLPDVDENIKKRLNAIKDTNDLDKENTTGNNKNTTLVKDLGERLANLKGIDYKEYNYKDIVHAKDKRSEQERIVDLIEQFARENQIDDESSNRSGGGAIGDDGSDDDQDPIKSIERRLAALKGTTTNTSKEEVVVVDDPTMVKNIVKKYLDEAALPDSDLTPEEKEFVNSQKPTADTEELPWCTICNEDAIIRCLDCADLFCRSCFKEIHDNDEEYREHQTKRYVKDENKSQNL